MAGSVPLHLAVVLVRCGRVAQQAHESISSCSSISERSTLLRPPPHNLGRSRSAASTRCPSGAAPKRITDIAHRHQLKRETELGVIAPLGRHETPVDVVEKEEPLQLCTRHHPGRPAVGRGLLIGQELNWRLTGLSGLHPPTAAEPQRSFSKTIKAVDQQVRALRAERQFSFRCSPSGSRGVVTTQVRH